MTLLNLFLFNWQNNQVGSAQAKGTSHISVTFSPRALPNVKYWVKVFFHFISIFIVKWYYFTKFSIINWQLKQVDCFNGAWYLHQKIKREIQQTMCKKWTIEYKLSFCSLKTFKFKKGNKYKEINKLQI